MSKAFENSLDTQNFTIIDGYAKAVSVLSRSYTPLCSISGGSDSDIVLDIIHNVDVKRMSATSGLIPVLNIRQLRNISTTLKTSTALRLNVSKPASQFQLVAKSTVSRFFQSTSANRLCVCNYTDFSGRTSRYLNFLKNIQTVKLPSNGGAMLTILLKAVLCR